MNVTHRSRMLRSLFLSLLLFVLSTAVFLTPSRQIEGTAHAGGALARHETEIANGRPRLSSLTVNPVEIDEGGQFILTGLLANSRPDSDFTVRIDWGDGQTSTKSFKQGCTCFSFSHSATDDDPSGTISDSYTITAELADDGEPFSKATAVITVNNVAPAVDIGPDLTRVAGQTIAFEANIRDPGTADTHSVDWNFGDGSPLQIGRKTEHTFTRAGSYTVTATATDDDGGSGQAAIQIKVTGAGYLPLVVK